MANTPSRSLGMSTPSDTMRTATIHGAAAQTRLFAGIDLAVGLLSLATQVFATGRFLKRFGSGIAAAALPAIYVVGFAALAVNGGVAWMLYRYRSGDANMRSVWICTRNDALGNVAVMLAALGVFGTASAWPDLVVAAVMGTLALWGAATVLAHARRELRVSAAHDH